ncbi:MULTISPECIES: Na+/H+ antiporter NhaA [Chryseobacterium]|uniref:Na(+)/H(+) antiporter NhaA n=2 Tax=Chryseobacterium TaxID=59732 RepID=A0ABU1EA79_9FLAO|nr:MULTISPECIES: Na+/H+ antiporter NhaA [Chryseobacterium]TXI89670.1 MAG: Na+/H+ antiporter NhaA [Chryseobacterium sp.]MCP1300196.1 Na+/H+ antiporter NhaA [Chryseobacterium sp. S0630]MDH5034064.1 Na+/H+ antiporter NhaA [Chryseobacterium cucumeris]MDR4954717.1 Na+/H+ antiporter NhaA [Chryseobacterium sp. ES2]QWT87487.1 Na+/H+ antiporter NhaA [Chryseobacterium sp. PCH239]
MNLSLYFKKFFNNSQSSGIILIFCVLISLLIANSSAAENFQHFLDQEVGTHLFGLEYPVSIWINDGLMAVFFLLVGLEIKRELVEGELSSFKNASLPIFAAVGGMLVPAVIYSIFNTGTEYSNGWGIPMATDIAFSLAIISMLGKKIPNSIKIFLAALAIVDDLGAILVIAIFYTEQIHWSYLLLSFGVTALLFILNFLKVTKTIFYIIPGLFLWYFLHHSGIHATIAGVLLAFSIPTNASNVEISPLEKLEHQLHIPVSFLIMPIFALTNTNITFSSEMVAGVTSTLGLGIICGLVLGKLIGINLFSLIAIKLKLSSLPQNSNWLQMIGVGLLAGIGFTMSIFIALLSFKGEIPIQDEAKFAILIASFIAAIAGFTILSVSSKENPELEEN